MRPGPREMDHRPDQEPYGTHDDPCIQPVGRRRPDDPPHVSPCCGEDEAATIVTGGYLQRKIWMAKDAAPIRIELKCHPVNIANAISFIPTIPDSRTFRDTWDRADQRSPHMMRMEEMMGDRPSEKS